MLKDGREIIVLSVGWDDLHFMFCLRLHSFNVPTDSVV